MKKHLLLIGTRDHTIDKLCKLDINYTLFQEANLVTKKQLDTAKRIVITDYQNSDEVLNLAKSIHAMDKFDAVISFAEYGLYPAALCASYFDIPSNNYNAVLNTRDKLKMRELLNKNNISTLRFKKCLNKIDAIEFYENGNKKPFILKPSSCSGSRGVSLIQDLSELDSAWERAIQFPDVSIIVEEFIDGEEYSVESLSLDNIHQIVAITEKLTTNSPYFIEIGHQSPARISAELESKIKTLVMNFLNIIEQTNGPAHTEIRISNNEPYIIESQTRIGGDQIWELTEITTGIDLMTETIVHLLNLPHPKIEPIAKAAAIRFFALEDCQINEIIDVEKAKSLPGIRRVHCDVEIGKKYNKMQSSSSRQGYVLGVGNTTDEAVENVISAINTVKFIKYKSDFETLKQTVL